MSILSVNPVLLFIMFSLGYVFGLLLRKPTAGKFLIFGFFGVFVYEPVKDAGVASSAAFLAGIIIHHARLLSVFEEISIWRAMRPAKPRAAKSQREAQQPDPEQSQRSSGDESPDETHRKFEEFVRRKRQKEQTGGQTHARGASQKTREEPSAGPQSTQEDPFAAHQEEVLRAAAEEIKRREAQLRAERERFKREQAEYSYVDTRSSEEILGLSGIYSFEDLKKARNVEARRWNPSNMANKPPHLAKQAEEELKRINGAFDELKKKFGAN